MKKYFYNDLPLKADLKRHSDKEKELLKRIEESSDPAFSNTYKRCLDILRQNKAKLASKIGKK
jgi:cobyrinic acid a,c-diamide synthase